MPAKSRKSGDLDRSKSYISRELSFLAFARRVLSLVGRQELPLLERIKFAGIVGMLHDEFFMKRVSGLKREIKKGSKKTSIDGRLPAEELEACRIELAEQARELDDRLRDELLPALEQAGLPIVDYADLDPKQKKRLRKYFKDSIQPILTPLTVDSEHPFPFVSNLGLSLAVMVPNGAPRSERFVRIKVPSNRVRFVPLPDRPGFVPLEQVIAANLDLLYPGSTSKNVHFFRVTRGAEGEAHTPSPDPGNIIDQVSKELKARRFAGVVRLQVDAEMPKGLAKWLAKQLRVSAEDVYPCGSLLGVRHLQGLEAGERDELQFSPHEPVTHPRLVGLPIKNPGAIFEEIAHGDLLLHHPYQSFDTSVLRFLESAAVDPAVLAIKLTIYRTSGDSPIVKALAEAARRGKQVAVLVEITARFDEAPNIAWGRFLEEEGVHVSYGVEKLKTHVKLALVVREEHGSVRRYAHVGTGNYHPGTARIYEDIGVLTCDEDLCEDVAAMFNSLTGTIPYPTGGKLIVAPESMRKRFVELIRREVQHAQAGRPAGIRAKMNQLQDAGLIRELYAASQAGVPIQLNVRGVCCLRPGVAGLSENIRVFTVVGRFLEHSRVFRFENGGNPEHFIGSADWMKRNLDGRVETAIPVEDPALREQLDRIHAVYDEDNCSVWDCRSDGTYVLRAPAEGERRREAQLELMRRARNGVASNSVSRRRPA